MTTAQVEREHWDALASDPANVGGVGMPDPSHYLTKLYNRCPSGVSDALDLGSGPGRLAAPFAEKTGATVWAVDVSAAMLSMFDHPNVERIVGDGRTVPAEVPPVQFAWSVLMFQHIPHEAQKGYVRQVAERLALGGVFVAQFVLDGPKHEFSHPTDAFDARRFAETTRLEMLEGVFDEIVPEWMWVTWVKR